MLLFITVRVCSCTSVAAVLLSNQCPRGSRCGPEVLTTTTQLRAQFRGERICRSCSAGATKIRDSCKASGGGPCGVWSRSRLVGRLDLQGGAAKVKGKRKYIQTGLAAYLNHLLLRQGKRKKKRTKKSSRHTHTHKANPVIHVACNDAPPPRVLS